MERDGDFLGSGWDQAHEPHDEQVQVWTDDVAEALLPWLKNFESYDDKVAFLATLAAEIKSVTEAAHAAGMIRAQKAAV